MPTATTTKKQRLYFVKNKIWPKLGYHPHQGQRPIHNSKARNKVASCGRRFGKSVIGGHELTGEALFSHNVRAMLKELGIRREFWIVGPEYSDSEKEFRVFWNDLKRLNVPMDHPGSYNNADSGGAMNVSLWDGLFKVKAMSAKHPETLVGEGLHGVIMGEAAKIKKSVWPKFIRPMLADFNGWSLHTSTPEGRNHFYELWQRGQDPNDEQWESWRMPSWVNPNVFPMGGSHHAVELIRTLIKNRMPVTPEVVANAGMDLEIYEMLKDMSETLFAQEVEADFSEYVGRVFKDFDEELHVKDLLYDPSLPLYAACDYGWTNPFVWLFIQVDVWNEVHVLGEYRAMQRDINDIARDLASVPMIKAVRKFYPDPADPGDTRVLQTKLRIPSDGNTGGEKKYRLEYIRNALKFGPEHAPFDQQRASLYIDRSCTGLIQEMNDYRYPENKSEVRPNKEDPLDKDDHGPEALGRFYRGYFGPGDAVHGSRSTRAKVGR